MTARQKASKRWTRWLGRGALVFAFAAGIVVIMFWLSGRFSPKVPVAAVADSSGAARLEGSVVRVRTVAQPVSESAVGTVRAVYEIPIRSKLLARVVEVNITAGQHVKAGEVLVRLDDADLRAKLEQAKAAVTSAEVARGQAVADQERNAALLQSSAISRQEYEKGVTAARAAEAELQRVQEAVNEMQATLDWATIRSSIDGTVIDKQVDAGEMVGPGQMLARLYDPTRMQLVANVRESLTRTLHVGDRIGVRIEGLDKECTGTVSEIVPEAQSSSRAFQVKVTGPCPEGIYSGMFGRILIPLGMELVTVIPRAAVRQVGQLELVQVVEQGQPIQRAIRTGRHLGDIRDQDGQVLLDQMEVLSGLRPGDDIVMPIDSPSPPVPATPASRDASPVSATTQEASHE